MKTARSLLQNTHPRAEADLILASLLHRSPFELYTEEVVVPPDIEDRFFALLAKRKTHTPLQYLVGTAPFLDLDLIVDERVFIPRPETEELVIKIFSKIKNPEIIFDLGTGSGAIAIALARHYPQATVIATDISEPALEVAKLNIRRYHLHDRIVVHAADLFAFPKSETFRNRVDLIVSNPPYIRTPDIKKLMTEVRDYEPRIALDGGHDGLAIIKPLIECAPRFLKPEGLLALEIDPGLVKAIARLTPERPEFEKDFAGQDRYMFFNYQ